MLVGAGVSATVGTGVGVGVGAAVGDAVGLGVGRAVGAGAEAGTSTPTAAYSTPTPYRVATDRPLTWVTLYQVEPDFQVGQDVPHDEPLTDPETVNVFASVSEVLIEALVDGLVRRFTAEQAGAIVWDDAAIGATAISTSIEAVMSAVSHRPRSACRRIPDSSGSPAGREIWVVMSIGEPIVLDVASPNHDPTGPTRTPPEGPTATAECRNGGAGR